MPEYTLTGGRITIRIDESANLGVIITALEIVEAGFGVVIVATVTQGVDLSHCTRSVNYLAVGVIVIGSYLRARSINQIHHVTLKVGNVIICRCCRAVVVDQAVRISSVIVNKIKRSGRFALGDRLPQQLSPSVDVLVSFRYGFFCFAAVEHRFLLGTILLLPGCRIVCGSPEVASLTPPGR